MIQSKDCKRVHWTPLHLISSLYETDNERIIKRAK